MKKITKDDVTFTIDLLPEDSSPRDLGFDEETAEYILERLEANEWGWCIVKVTARLEEWTGSAYLGGCSYESESEFVNDPYFDDLCNDAFERLVEEIDSTVTALRKLDII